MVDEAQPTSGSLQPNNNDPLDAYTALLQWMAQQDGHLHESVQIARDDARGVHLQVRKDWKDRVPKETRIIKTPLSSTMSYFNAIDYRPAGEGDGKATATFSAHGVHLPKAFMEAVGPEEASVFFLMGQYLRGSEGFWAPYIRTLPQPGALTTPLYYEGDDLEWLEGTSLLGAREQKMKLFEDKYEHGIGELRKVGFGDVERYTWDLYLWASTIFVSRAFSSKVLSEAIADEDLSEDVSVLLPFIDILNHRPLAKVEWRAGDNDVFFLTLEDVAAGEEIANNYGPRNNEQLMVNYGFCLSNNPCDYRIVSLRAPPGSPLYEAKFEQRRMYPELAKEADDPYYVFNIFYPLLAPDTPMEHSIFSPALFNAVSVLAANDRELESLEISEQGIRIPNQYGTSRTILAALSQIIIELITHVVKLRASAGDLQEPKNIKQTHGKIYRESQIMLSETALIIAAWTLNRARQHGFTRSWEETKHLLGAHIARVPAGKFPEEIVSRIRVRILERPSILTANGELFALNDLYNILPEKMRQPCRSSLQSILTTTERAIPVLRGSGESSPFVLPIFVCFITAVYCNATDTSELPPRLVKWARFLLEKYPPPPDDIAWMLEDEDDEQLASLFDEEVLETMRSRNQAVFDDLAAFTGDWKGDSWWLSPNWVRWAWMLVEQESVQAPDDPLQMLSAGGPRQGSVMLSTVSYLYIPQDVPEQ